MIVSGGVNIYPAEIEGVLAEHPAIADVAVFGIPDEEMGESVHAALALGPGLTWSDPLHREVVGFCRERLAGYKVPAELRGPPALSSQRGGQAHEEGPPRGAHGGPTSRDCIIDQAVTCWKSVIDRRTDRAPMTRSGAPLPRPRHW